jgi:hypothetical protein
VFKVPVARRVTRYLQADHDFKIIGAPWWRIDPAEPGATDSNRHVRHPRRTCCRNLVVVGDERRLSPTELSTTGALAPMPAYDVPRHNLLSSLAELYSACSERLRSLAARLRKKTKYPSEDIARTVLDEILAAERYAHLTFCSQILVKASWSTSADSLRGS